jgi:uncharacterized protein (TIGR00255 family)
MTAFATSEALIENYKLIWEVRTVNHRYLDISPRLPESFRSIEPALRVNVAKHLKRGKVDCNLFYKKEQQTEDAIEVNEGRVKAVLNATSFIEKQMNQTQMLSSLDILRWPGVQAEVSQDMAPIHEKAVELLGETLQQLVESREREGEQITAMIETRCDQIQQQVVLAKQRLPEVQRLLREKLQLKIADLLTNCDQERLEQELVILLQKLDVDEEMDRLDTHVKEVRRVLTQKDPVGRRLDFLMQELNREANTLGSKSMDTETTNISVELKVLIEQMREQIQNIE